ncbi:alpha/beta fold hydrolase [Acuticoccus sp. MNP-M23]|uniref:alpha/beta fold hydrolase n=1 Tax=Acuticoccus sp. MNP-M23 TaxID=3072793 RepID=UPI002814F792|nr:alpha/beta fold hydrolase [Acuticoccus sp. MNP-M23]WMS43525.1 alpha/beta fold hydrolase [Acuticoccus sp. MNP-M23]
MPHFIEIDGRALHCEFRPGAAGRTPVVFSNSLGTDLRIWDGVVALLPAQTPILRLDKRGHGLSAMGPVTIAALAEDMAAAMAHFGLTAACACGVSVGGLIVQALAASRPDLVATAVLSNTGLKIGNDAMWNERIEIARTRGLEAMADAIITRWFSPGYVAGQATDLAGYRAMLTRTPAEGYARVSEAIRDADLTADAGKLHQRTVCIAGETDASTPVAMVTALSEALPDAALTVVPAVGHLPCIETPKIVFDAIASLGALD